MKEKVNIFKLGGAALRDLALAESLIFRLKKHILPGKSLLVHGGGGQITYWLDKFGLKTVFNRGQRVTGEEEIKVVEMVLSGRVNKAITGALTRSGFRAAGISGRDCSIGSARILDPSLGRVGETENIDTFLIRALMDKGVVPVLSPVCSSEKGEAINVNADFFAAALACAACARELNFITSTGGVLVEGQLAENIKSEDIPSLISEGVVSEGMIPKLQASLKALEGGVEKINMIDFKGKKGTTVI